MSLSPSPYGAHAILYDEYSTDLFTFEELRETVGLSPTSTLKYASLLRGWGYIIIFVESPTPCSFLGFAEWARRQASKALRACTKMVMRVMRLLEASSNGLPVTAMWSRTAFNDPSIGILSRGRLAKSAKLPGLRIRRSRSDNSILDTSRKGCSAFSF